MAAILVGLIVGATIGVVSTLVVVVDPLRRERNVWRDRIIREQMRTFAADARLQAHLNSVRGNDSWSRKVTELRPAGGAR
jgi:gas vesicle protein